MGRNVDQDQRVDRIKDRVLRSGPVRFFGQKRKDRDRDRFSSSEIYLKTGPDRVGPVCCSFLRSINWFGTGFYQDQFRPVRTGL